MQNAIFVSFDLLGDRMFKCNLVQRKIHLTRQIAVPRFSNDQVTAFGPRLFYVFFAGLQKEHLAIEW
jgi:hypothetical protein